MTKQELNDWRRQLEEGERRLEASAATLKFEPALPDTLNIESLGEKNNGAHDIEIPRNVPRLPRAIPGGYSDRLHKVRAQRA
jgi:hypothetical protein